MAALFVRALLLVGLLIALGIAFYPAWPFALGAAGLWLLAWLIRELRYWQAWRRNRYERLF